MNTSLVWAALRSGGCISSGGTGRDVSEFGIVRPKVQIPGPRTNFLYSKSASSEAVCGRRITAGPQSPAETIAT